MPPALSRSFLAVLTLALLMVGAFALPAEASQGAPVDSSDGGAVVAWGGRGAPGTTSALAGRTVTAIAAGSGYDLALTSDGRVTGWGSNGSGQATIPASLDDKTVTGIAAGRYHSLALTADGSITAWGNNSYGQLNVPAGLQDETVTAISAGFYHSLALTSDGTITAWGDNSDGQLNVPASLSGKTVTAVAAGPYTSFALTSDGRLTGWGYDYYGQAGVPASLDTKTVIAVAPGLYQTLALTSDGKVTAWGGSPSTGEGVVPAGLDDKTVVAIAANRADSFALTSDGEVVAWGDNSQGQTSLPVGLDNVSALSAGEYHAIAIQRTVLPAGAPTVTGTPQVGTELSATTGSYNATPDSVSYQWKADGSDVGASLATYTPAGADVGKAITVTVTATKTGYAPSSTTSAATAAVAEEPVADEPFTTGPTASITGTPEVGQTLTADEGDASPVPDSYSYQWAADGTPISGAQDKTFTPTTAQQGATITVDVTATKAGYADASDTSPATGAVAVGRLAVTGSLSVGGTAKVGHTLTATSTLATTPTATLSGQWLRDGSPIDGATASTYLLTNADAGTGITYQVTATTDGYADAPTTSSSVGPVDGGVITPSAPTITGTPRVGSPLTGAVSGVDPADADVALAWKRGETVVGSGSTYTPSAADAGHVLSLTATYTKDHFDAAGATTDTGTVAKAVFSTGPEASVSGTAKVGQPLTAGVGAPSPTPDSYSFRWFADGTAISGAQDRTFTPTTAQQGATITVEVTATRAGFDSASDLSAPTAAVANSAAPTISLRVTSATIRRGQPTRLTWTSAGAATVTATGGWSGTKALHGTLTVRPSRLGTTTYTLRATNENGTAVAQTSVTVRRPAHHLHVAASNGLRLRGHTIAVRAGGLDPHEAYVIRVAGRLVATGHATRSGALDRSVMLPTTTHEGRVPVSVIGSEADRTGADTVRVVAGKRLGLRLAKQRVRASDHQRVTVTGLAAGERVTLSYQGRRISPRGAHATARGTWATTFGVDVFWGTKTVKVTGQYSTRRAQQTFQVVRRCANGVHRCR